MTIKTSDLINKLVLASEAGCKCEDENFFRTLEFLNEKSPSDPVTIEDMSRFARAITDFTRFSSIRTVCKVLQDLGIAESDVDVMNNEEFRNTLAKSFE